MNVNHKRGILFGLLGFSLFACGDACFKYLGATYTPLQAGFYSTCFNILYLVICSPFMGGFAAVWQSKRKKLHLIRGAFLVAQFLTIIYAFANATLASTYALVFIAPFVTALLGIILLRQPVSKAHWLIIAIGFTGVLVVLRPGFEHITLPMVAALVSAVLFAIVNVMVQFIDKGDERILSFAAYPLLVFFPVLGIAFLIDPAYPGFQDMLMFALSAVFSTSGFVATANAFKIGRPAMVAPMHYVQMLWGIVLGYVFFDDVLDPWVGVGAAIIIGSGIWLLRRPPPQIILPEV